MCLTVPLSCEWLKKNQLIPNYNPNFVYCLRFNLSLKQKLFLTSRFSVDSILRYLPYRAKTKFWDKIAKNYLWKWLNGKVALITYPKKTRPWKGNSWGVFPSQKPEGISKFGNNIFCTSWKSKHFLFYTQGHGTKIEPAMPSWKLNFRWP